MKLDLIVNWFVQWNFGLHLKFFFLSWFLLIVLYFLADEEKTVNWFHGNDSKRCQPKHESNSDRLARGSKFFLSQSKKSLKNNLVNLYSLFSPHAGCWRISSCSWYFVPDSQLHWPLSFWQRNQPPTAAITWCCMHAYSCVRFCFSFHLLSLVVITMLAYWFGMLGTSNSENTRRYVHHK